MIVLSIAGIIALSTSAVTGLSYVKVSDSSCNKCTITNGGTTRKCGQCGGFLNGGKEKLVEGDWIQAVFTCNKCSHQSTWKYKMK